VETVKNLATVVGLVVALWGLVKGIFEYQLQGAQKRADFFLGKQGEFFANKSFNTLRTLLDHDQPALAAIPVEERRAYATFFEEVAIAVNTSLIREDLAYYMFGYYAVKCHESTNFWSGLFQTEEFWGVFIAFAKRMKVRFQAGEKIDPIRIRF
jgi:hypothetical protein